MSERLNAWPSLVYEDLAPMVDYVNRLVQVGGKYTLDEPFEASWGNIVLDVTPAVCGRRLFGARESPSRCTTGCSTVTWSSSPIRVR